MSMHPTLGSRQHLRPDLPVTEGGVLSEPLPSLPTGSPSPATHVLSPSMPCSHRLDPPALPIPCHPVPRHHSSTLLQEVSRSS